LQKRSKQVVFGNLGIVWSGGNEAMDEDSGLGAVVAGASLRTDGCLCPTGCTDDAAQRRRKLATVEGISEYRLANGLRCILFPDAAKPTATVNVTYLVGSRHENYGETGMAHLLEHLIFKGSKNFVDPARQFQARGFEINGSDLARSDELLSHLSRPAKTTSSGRSRGAPTRWSTRSSPGKTSTAK
jgi:hypothetical protein